MMTENIQAWLPTDWNKPMNLWRQQGHCSKKD